MARAKKILVVDDEDELRFAVKIVLEKAGYRVAETADGEQAVDTWVSADRKGEPFDLLITDVHMRGLSGPEVVERIRASGAPMPAGIVTWSCYSEASRGWNGGVPGERLEKPFTPEELLLKVREVLSRSRPSDETAVE